MRARQAKCLPGSWFKRYLRASRLLPLAAHGHASSDADNGGDGKHDGERRVIGVTRLGKLLRGLLGLAGLSGGSGVAVGEGRVVALDGGLELTIAVVGNRNLDRVLGVVVGYALDVARNLTHGEGVGAGLLEGELAEGDVALGVVGGTVHNVTVVEELEGELTIGEVGALENLRAVRFTVAGAAA